MYADAENAKARKRQCGSLKMTKQAWELAKPKLEKRWSPEQVAEWLKKEYPEHAMSAKTIRNYITYHIKGELKRLAVEDLRQRGKKRKKAGSEEKRGKIPEMTLIDERPPEIGTREAGGHWEGDLIIGKGHKSAILVTVERKSRFVQIELPPIEWTQS